MNLGAMAQARRDGISRAAKVPAPRSLGALRRAAQAAGHACVGGFEEERPALNMRALARPVPLCAALASVAVLAAAFALA